MKHHTKAILAAMRSGPMSVAEMTWHLGITREQARNMRRHLVRSGQIEQVGTEARQPGMRGPLLVPLYGLPGTGTAKVSVTRAVARQPDLVKAWR